MPPLRSPKKPPQKREPKKTPKEQTFQDVCKELLEKKWEEERERREAPLRAAKQAQEDEVMAMLYGPNWRDVAPA